MLLIRKHLFFSQLAISFLFLLSLAGCRAPLSDENLMRLSDLELLVSSAQNNLSWDDTHLQQRVDSMEMKLDYLKKALKDTGETAGALARYAAIAANYKTYIKQAPALEYDLDKYREEIIQLKEKALAGEVSNEDFEKRYNELRPSLININKTTEPLWYNVWTVEGDYTRYNKIVTEKWMEMGGK